MVTQAYHNFEHIVIDGGSTDGTVDIIRRYEPHLAYWHSKSDRGISHAFNLGVENSSGKWLLFINSDDFLAGSNVLNQMAGYLKQNEDADVVLGQVMVISREHGAIPIGGPYGRPFRWREFIFRVTIPHQAAFINRSYFDRMGLFNEDFLTTMDYEHFLRAGPSLRVVFKPILVAYMRDQGVGKQNIRTGLRELCKAQIETGALPPLVAKCNYVHMIVRSMLSRTFLGKAWRSRRSARLTSIDIKLHHDQ